MQFTQDPDKLTCPYTGHKKLCKKLRDNCPKWVKLVGTNPQTGVPVDEWACADTWEPILLVEISQKLNQQGASLDSFRNEMVRQGHMALRLTALNGKPKPKELIDVTDRDRS